MYTNAMARVNENLSWTVECYWRSFICTHVVKYVRVNVYCVTEMVL